MSVIRSTTWTWWEGPRFASPLQLGWSCLELAVYSGKLRSHNCNTWWSSVCFPGAQQARYSWGTGAVIHDTCKWRGGSCCWGQTGPLLWIPPDSPLTPRLGWCHWGGSTQLWEPTAADFIWERPKTLSQTGCAQVFCTYLWAGPSARFGHYFKRQLIGYEVREHSFIDDVSNPEGKYGFTRTQNKLMRSTVM